MRRFGFILLLLTAFWPAISQASVTEVVSNAPIWHTSTSYSVVVPPARWGSRVNSGPGTIGGTYTPASAVYVWEAQNNGTSASSGNGPQTCGTPGTTTFTESTGLIWKCLAVADYSTLGGFLFDCPAYPTGVATLFHFHQCAKNAAGQVYRADQGTPTSPVDGTTAGGSGPSGTTNGQTDGTVSWDFIYALPYWSAGASPIPAQYYNPSTVAPMSQTYNAQMFSGGIAALEYLAGSGGEPPVFTFMGHFDCTPDTGASNENCPAPFTANFINLKCAPIDCPTSQPLVYDNTKYVALHNTAAASVTNGAIDGFNLSIPTNYGVAFHRDTALSQQDSTVGVNGLAIKSDNGVPIEGNRPDVMVLQNSILDGSGPIGWYTDAFSYGLNVTVINRSSAAGAIGVGSSYAALYENLTIYMPNASSTAICLAGFNTNVLGSNPFGGSGNPLWSNIAAFGCPIWAAIDTPQVGNWAPDGIKQFGNVTSAAATSSAPTVTIPYGTASFTGVAPAGVSGSACGGSCASLSFAGNFTGASDLRPLAAAPMLAAGGAFSMTPGSVSYPGLTITNATDFFGTTRSPAYDPGAAQFVSTALAPMPLAGIVP